MAMAQPPETQPLEVPRPRREASVERIEEAARTIDPVFLDSPQFEVEAARAELGLRLFVKVETVNPIRSFKGRGACFLLNQLPGDVSEVVCASAGNFGQGLAWAARRQGLSLQVFAAESANPAKVEHMGRLGAQVHLVGRDFDEAKEAARASALNRGACFVEDGREPEIAEGAGTLARELGRLGAAFDAVLVPVGNGSLIIGIGTWLRAHSPSTQVIGVVAEGAPAMALSFSAGRPIATAATQTTADGLAVRVPVPEALQAMQRSVDEVVMVSEAALAEAASWSLCELGLVLEPAGAAGLAAARTYRSRFSGATVATVLCGGNVDPGVLPIHGKAKEGGGGS